MLSCSYQYDRCVRAPLVCSREYSKKQAWPQPVSRWFANRARTSRPPVSCIVSFHWAGLQTSTRGRRRPHGLGASRYSGHNCRAHSQVHRSGRRGHARRGRIRHRLGPCRWPRYTRLLRGSSSGTARSRTCRSPDRELVLHKDTRPGRSSGPRPSRWKPQERTATPGSTCCRVHNKADPLSVATQPRSSAARGQDDDDRHDSE